MARYGKLFELRRSGGLREIADLWAFENENNPDAVKGNPLVDSNPVDVLADRGRFIVADAGGNTLLRARRGGDLEVLSLFPNILQPNPSSRRRSDERRSDRRRRRARTARIT